MANPEHLKILERGVEVWNRWREENPVQEISDFEYDFPDLSGGDLTQADFAGADFSQTILDEADFSGATLRQADFSGGSLESTILHGADTTEAVFAFAHLFVTDLRGANLRAADFDNALFGETLLTDIDLSEALHLETAHHIAPSIIDTRALAKSRGLLPEPFLRGCGLSDWEIGEGSALVFYSAFISYSHENKPFARSLHDQLQARGIRCWLDEHDLKPGDRILDIVDRAIRLHDKILLCCSEASLNSWWVKDEIRKAQERERRDGRDIIIPLMVDRYLLDGWEDGLAADLRSRLAADFTGWEHDNARFEEQFERVVRALRTE